MYKDVWRCVMTPDAHEVNLTLALHYFAEVCVLPDNTTATKRRAPSTVGHFAGINRLVWSRVYLCIILIACSPRFNTVVAADTSLWLWRRTDRWHSSFTSSVRLSCFFLPLYVQEKPDKLLGFHVVIVIFISTSQMVNSSEQHKLA